MNHDVLEDIDDQDVADDTEAEPVEERVVREERLEDHTVDSRKKLREQLQSEVEAFLARGGKIQVVDTNITADPPQKPTNNYCSRPI
jgi:hypothetical protein